MIRYTLTCDQGHEFESWFASNAACDSLLTAGQVACVQCGSAKVSKSLMAPAVAPARRRAAAPPDEPPAKAAKPRSGGPLSAPRNEMEKALAALRREIEANSEYVGMRFASEARAMHAGDAPERAIFGEARPEEAKALIEDGIPVAPLPFLPARKAN